MVKCNGCDDNTNKIYLLDDEGICEGCWLQFLKEYNEDKELPYR